MITPLIESTSIIIAAVPHCSGSVEVAFLSRALMFAFYPCSSPTSASPGCMVISKFLQTHEPVQVFRPTGPHIRQSVRSRGSVVDGRLSLLHASRTHAGASRPGTAGSRDQKPRAVCDRRPAARLRIENAAGAQSRGPRIGGGLLAMKRTSVTWLSTPVAQQHHSSAGALTPLIIRKARPSSIPFCEMPHIASNTLELSELSFDQWWGFSDSVP
jgi:hypothetical protein